MYVDRSINCNRNTTELVSAVSALKDVTLEQYILRKGPSASNIIIISIQPEGRVWQEPEPSQATGMALAHCILGSFLGVGCHCFPPPLDVPTFVSRCLHVQAT